MKTKAFKCRDPGKARNEMRAVDRIFKKNKTSEYFGHIKDITLL